MGIWSVISIITIISCLLGILYMVWAVRQFPALMKITGGRKIPASFLAFVLVAGIFSLFYYYMSLVNAMVIFLFVMAFRMILGIAGHIIEHIRKTPFKTYWQGYLSLLLCAVYLTVGYIICHTVVATGYDLNSDKDPGELKVAMFADSHLGTVFDAGKFGEHMDKIMAKSPDIVLIVGDFVDDGTTRAEMVKACAKLGTLSPKYGVWYVFGNHDRGYYRDGQDSFTGEDLEAELEKNNVHVLVDEVELIDDRFYLVGREDAYKKDRTPIKDLLDGLDTDKYIIVMDHQPTDYDNEAAAGADLVLSGHTHGGQLFPVTYVGEWFNINDRTYGYERRGKTDFIVTSGIADWEILFKTGTISEYVIITVN